MKLKSQNLFLVLTLFSITSLYMPAFGAITRNEKVQIPAQAISPRTMMVFYIDYDQLTLSNIKATLDTFTSAIPDKDKRMRQSIKKAIDAQINKQKKLIDSARKGHVHALVMIATPAQKVLQTQRGQSGSKQRKLVTKQPASKVMLFLGDDSTTTGGIAAAMKQVKAIEKMRGQENKVHQNPPEISRFTGNWFIAKWPKQNKKSAAKVTFDVPKDAGDKAAAARFEYILNKAKGAAVRVAFMPNQIFRKNMAGLARISQLVAKNKRSQSGSTNMGSLYGALSELKYALISATLGKSPALDVKVEFASTNATKAASKTVMQLVSAVEKGIKQRLDKMKNPPSADLIKKLFQDLQPTVKGNMLALGVDKQFLENLAKLTSAVVPFFKNIKTNS